MVNKLKYIVLVLLPFLLYGCVNNNPPATTPTPTQASEPAVLRWWDLFDDQKDVQPLIDEYVSQNPNVTIQFLPKPLNGDVKKYVSDLDAVIQDKSQTPDIFPIYNTWAGKYEPLVEKAPANLITDADLSEYYDIVKKDFYINKGLVALPQAMDSLGIIYNVSRLQEKGFPNVSTQWSEFKAMAEKLTKYDSSNKVIAGGFSAGFYDNVEFKFDMINLLMLLNGIKMTDVTNTSAIFYNAEQKDDTDSALNFYNALGKATWSKDLKKDIAEFMEGRLAMYAAPSWRLIDILNYNKQYNLNLKIGTAQVPQLTNKNIYWPMYWGYAVSKTSPKSAEAWKFIKFLNEKQNLTLYDKTVKENGRPIGIIFPIKSMNTELAQDKLLGPYVVSLDKADDWYMRDGLAMQTSFESVFAKIDDKGNKTPDFSGLQGGATSIIQKK